MGRKGTKDRQMVTRREFLRVSGLVAAGAGLAACGGEAAAPITVETAAPAAEATTAASTAAPAAETAAPAGTAAETGATTAAETAAATAETTAAGAGATTAAATPTTFKEAPMLAELVAAGDLPPVDQRLPKNPVVLDGLAGIGKYGGTIRRGYNGVSDYFGPNKVQQVSLVWYNNDLSIRPDLAESWQVSDDATTYTFKMREGLKWSDGSDLTTENFKWWHENVLSNETLAPLSNSGRGSFSTGTPPVPMEVEFPDATTAVFTFAQPNPLFIYQVTRAQPFSPIEYMQQFHIDFADKAELEAKTKEAGFETWDQLFNDRNRPAILGRPSVGTWLPTNEFGEQLFVMERNPYFAQVDSEGNQLPYVDRVTHLLFESVDAFGARILAGEIDYQARHVSIGNFTLYKEGEGQGDYQVMLGVTANHEAWQPNQTTKNEKLREFFQNRDVRIALSLAINRQEINDLAFNGTATPRQYSPLAASPQSHPEQANVYIEYDPARANELLDQAGYAAKDAQGMRLWKDGSGPISFTIEGTSTGDPREDAALTVVRYFTDVGVQCAYKAVERALYTQHYEANEIESAFWGGDRTLLPLVAPIIFIGTQPDRPWSVAWGKWRINPDDPQAEEPPQDHFIRDLWKLWDQIAVEPDEQKRNELFSQILDIWAVELPMIGILGEIPAPVIVKNGLMGPKPDFPIDDPTKDEHLINTQTLYWDEPEQHA